MGSRKLIPLGVRFPNPHEVVGYYDEWSYYYSPNFAGCNVKGVVDLTDFAVLERFSAPMNEITGLLGYKELPLRTIQLGENALAGVFDASGMATLEELWLYYNETLTGVDLTGCTGLMMFAIDSSGVAAIDVSDCVQLCYAYAYDCAQLASIVGLANTQIDSVGFFNCALPEAEVDGVLAACVIVGKEYGWCDLSGGSNAPPSAEGEGYKTILESRGWSVMVNS